MGAFPATFHKPVLCGNFVKRTKKSEIIKEEKNKTQLDPISLSVPSSLISQKIRTKTSSDQLKIEKKNRCRNKAMVILEKCFQLHTEEIKSRKKAQKNPDKQHSSNSCLSSNTDS
jgi:hypothetical protein